MMGLAVTRAGAVAGGVLVLDQITKLIALASLVPGASVHVIDGLLAVTLVMNPGLAFGLLAGVPSGWRWVVALLSFVALVVLVQVARRICSRSVCAGAPSTVTSRSPSTGERSSSCTPAAPSSASATPINRFA